MKGPNVASGHLHAQFLSSLLQKSTLTVCLLFVNGCVSGCKLTSRISRNITPGDFRRLGFEFAAALIVSCPSVEKNAFCQRVALVCKNWS